MKNDLKNTHEPENRKEVKMEKGLETGRVKLNRKSIPKLESCMAAADRAVVLLELDVQWD